MEILIIFSFSYESNLFLKNYIRYVLNWRLIPVTFRLKLITKALSKVKNVILHITKRKVVSCSVPTKSLFRNQFCNKSFSLYISKPFTHHPKILHMQILQKIAKNIFIWKKWLRKKCPVGALLLQCVFSTQIWF